MKVKKDDWNPNKYLQFKNERTQPAIDLVNRIDLEKPRNIIDLGCGAGNSTEILFTKYPDAKVVGMDNSPAMISKAKELYPDLDWRLGDIRDLGNEKYDIVFSNATIQWIPDHNDLLPRLISIVDDDGILALQIPLYHEMPIASLIDELFHKQFQSSTFDINSVFTFHSSAFYFNLVVNKVSSLSIWETTYLHIMESTQKIYDMIETTGMKPYFDEIHNEDEKAIFIKNVIDGIGHTYKLESSGKVIFPFKRLFILARK